jgi:translation initiation factor 1A
MVKKTGGGNKHKKKKNNPSTTEVERELIFKVESQEYAQVTKILGNCRLEVQCFDGKTRLANIRGSMRKKVWIKMNDVVLVSLREYEDGKCDVIHKYDVKEVNRLKSLDEIPKTVKLSDELDDKQEDIGIDFIEDGDEDEHLPKKEINFDEI